MNRKFLYLSKQNDPKTEFEELIEEIIKLEKEKAVVVEKILELGNRVGIPYLSFVLLCKLDHYAEVQKVFEKWKGNVEYVPSDTPDSKPGKLIFNEEIHDSVMKDLAILVNHKALACPTRQLIAFITERTNLGESIEAVGKKLKRNIKRFKHVNIAVF